MVSATEGILANIRECGPKRPNLHPHGRFKNQMAVYDQDPVVPFKTSRNVSKKTGKFLSKYRMGATWDGFENEANIKDFLLLSIFLHFNRF